MIHLKKLSLFLLIGCQRGFIDGNHLKANVLRYIPRLEDFAFNLRSILPLDVESVHFPSNEDIRWTLTELSQHPIVSSVDYFFNEHEAHCHIYTSPYSLFEYEYLSNNSPDGLFVNVRYVELFDERPFEHSFFLRLAQSFPSMKTLTVNNEVAQREKQDQQSEDEGVPIVEYVSLRRINLLRVHDDYVEQFFFATRTLFSDDMQVRIGPNQLKRVTSDGTRDETRINYSKVKFEFWSEVDWAKLV